MLTVQAFTRACTIPPASKFSLNEDSMSTFPCYSLPVMGRFFYGREAELKIFGLHLIPKDCIRCL